MDLRIYFTQIRLWFLLTLWYIQTLVVVSSQFWSPWCNARYSYEVQYKWLQCKVYLCSAMQDFAVAAALSQRGGRPRWQREILEYKIGNNMLECKVQSTEYRQSTICRRYRWQRDILLLFSEPPITPSLAVSWSHQVATTYCLTLKMKRSYIDRVLSCSWIDLVLFWN